VTNLNQALDDIQLIRNQLARSCEFRGYGPTTNAATAAVALLASVVQARWVSDPVHAVTTYLAIWLTTATLSLGLISIETIQRTRRIHSSLAMEMLHSAIQQFLPAIVAGLLLTVVLWRYAPQNLGMLPGLWQVIFSLGIFASCQFLPRATFAAGVWYLGTGLTCLVLGKAQSLSPWAMGIPFGVGQLLVACVLQFGFRSPPEEA
jgi:hypothetical protein